MSNNVICNLNICTYIYHIRDQTLRKSNQPLIFFSFCIIICPIGGGTIPRSSFAGSRPVGDAALSSLCTISPYTRNLVFRIVSVHQSRDHGLGSQDGTSPEAAQALLEELATRSNVRALSRLSAKTARIQSSRPCLCLYRYHTKYTCSSGSQKSLHGSLYKGISRHGDTLCH